MLRVEFPQLILGEGGTRVRFSNAGGTGRPFRSRQRLRTDLHATGAFERGGSAGEAETLTSPRERCWIALRQRLIGHLPSGVELGPRFRWIEKRGAATVRRFCIASS